MNMITHNDKRKNIKPLILLAKLQTINYNIPVNLPCEYIRPLYISIRK